MPERVAVATSHFALALDDQVALIKDCSGGAIKGQVVTTSVGPQQPAEKHIGSVKYESFTIDVGLPTGKPLSSWITAALALSPTRKKGYVAAVNFDNKVQSYRHFRDALIEEITIPAMDGASKEAGFLTIKFQPEQITYAKGDNAVLANIVNVKQKKWLCANFRLRLGNLPCGRVSRIDSFTIKQGIADTVGETRVAPSKKPTSVEFPNLKVMFSAADVGPWQDWFTEFVVNGQNDQKKELQGSLEFLDPTMQEVVGSVEFNQVGIFSLQMEKQDANTETIARYVAELYVEKMNLKSFD